MAVQRRCVGTGLWVELLSGGLAGWVCSVAGAWRWVPKVQVNEKQGLARSALPAMQKDLKHRQGLRGKKGTASCIGVWTDFGKAAAVSWVGAGRAYGPRGEIVGG